jgi:hypothetical protein
VLSIAPNTAFAKNDDDPFTATSNLGPDTGVTSGSDPDSGKNSSSGSGSAVLVDNDLGLTFALNVPNNSSNELFFHLEGPSDQSWIAVGLGSRTMAGTLILLVYSSSNGKNVTLSPRLTQGHVEPSYTSTVDVKILPGSGISNGLMTVNALCSNCRSWKTGSLDVADTKQEMILAVGPEGSINSDSKSASLKRHATYSHFNMDLVSATGPAGVPTNFANMSNAQKEGYDTNDHNYASGLHAFIMVFTYLGLMPFGILVLRVVNSVRWHLINQVFAVFLAFIGAVVGVYAGTFFNRVSDLSGNIEIFPRLISEQSKHFNSGHQIFGLFITVAILVQVVLGFFHHSIYKRTKAPTKIAPIHIWLGRIIIPAGVANAFVYVLDMSSITCVANHPQRISILSQHSPRLRSHPLGHLSSSCLDAGSLVEKATECEESKA